MRGAATRSPWSASTGSGVPWLLSLEEKIDTSSVAGELVFHVFGAIAHFERRAEGVTSANGIAKALNERDIATPRGGK